MTKLTPEMIIEKFNSLDEKLRYAAFGFLLLIVFLLDFALIMNFQLRFIQNSNAEIKTLSADIGRVVADKQRIAQMRKGLESSRAQLQAMNIKVRSVQEVPAILEDISRLANEVGLKIYQLTPQRDTQETLITSPEGNYYALPIMIQARGGYHIFGRFLNRLENANLFFSVRDLRIEAQEKDHNNQLISIAIKVILIDRSATPIEAKKP